jgi:recombination protein RecT
LSANDYLKSIAEKNPASLLQSVKNVASIGLSLSPAEKLAYLVPRKGKVCLDVSYVGLCRLATNSGSIEWIQAELYYSNDKFTNTGIGERPVHEFDGFATIEQRGDFRGMQRKFTGFETDQRRISQRNQDHGLQTSGRWRKRA